jgi:TfoX/Sxy family transcriptional regulator of competence genes
MANQARAKRPVRTPKSSAKASLDPRFGAVVDAFAKDEEVTFGTMMASVGLKVRGKIFAMYVRDRFVTKLPEARVDALVQTGLGQRFDPGHGRLMREWVSTDDSKVNWVALAKEAHAFVKAQAPT